MDENKENLIPEQPTVSEEPTVEEPTVEEPIVEEEPVVEEEPEMEEPDVPVQSAFAGAEVYEDTPDWDSLLGKNVTEASQQKSKKRLVQKWVIGILAVAVVLLSALLMTQSGSAKKAKFMDEHIALINPGTGVYHTYDCEDFDRNSFVAYNIQTAEKKGYHPCEKCHQ